MLEVFESTNETPPETHRFVRIGALLAIVLCVAVAIRMLAYYLLPQQPLPDAISYQTAAKELFEQGSISNHTIMPFYSLLIMLSGNRLGQAAMDIGLSIVNVWLCYKLTLALFGDRVAGLVAAAVAALYPFMIFYAVVGLSENLFVTLILAAFLALYSERILISSILFACAILTRPSIEIFVPFVIFWFCVVVAQLTWPRTFRNLLVFALVYLLLMAPWWYHNYLKYHQFVHLNLGSGLVLYTGNNPKNLSGGGITGIDSDVARFQRIKDPVERDKAYRTAALKFISEQPQTFFWLAMKRIERFWRLLPFAPEYRGNGLAQIAAISFLPFLVCAVATVATRLDLFRNLTPLLGFVAYLTLIHAMTIGSIRYRFPIEPILIILAAPTIVQVLASVPFGRTLIDQLRLEDPA